MKQCNDRITDVRGDVWGLQMRKGERQKWEIGKIQQ